MNESLQKRESFIFLNHSQITTFLTIFNRREMNLQGEVEDRDTFEPKKSVSGYPDTSFHRAAAVR